MDQLSSLYVRMASGAQSQLHSPAAVMGFVDQMHTRIEKSSAPRKNYLVDPSTPHSDVVIAESSALKPSVGWVTLQVTEGIRRGIHEWGIKVEHQGESNDESGLMLGIVPKNFSKYDTFISQGGGWCLSRAGKFYGHWRRTDMGGGAITFGTGDRVVLTLDYDAAVMTVRVGEKTVVGELSGLTMEVFPAISLHYRHQHIRFDHHAVRETTTQHQPWLQRQCFPAAPAFVPLPFHAVVQMPLQSYLFSGLFQHRASLEGGSATAMSEADLDEGADAEEKKEEVKRATTASPISPSDTPPHLVLTAQLDDSTGGSMVTSSSTARTRRAEQQAMRLYMSAEAAAARLTVLSRALAAVRRYVAVLPSKHHFLSPDVTAEFLRRRLYEVVRESGMRSGGSGGGFGTWTNTSIEGNSAAAGGRGSDPARGFGTGAAGYDAAMNCGAVMVVHLFLRAVSGGEAVATPLVESFRDYLLSLPMFALVESQPGDDGGRSVLAPATVQLVVDHIISLLEPSLGAAAESEATGAQKGRPVSPPLPLSAASSSPSPLLSVSPLTAALLEVAVLLALQRGLVSEVLRVCRYLLRVPAGVLSTPLVHWLYRHAAMLAPQPPLPDLGRALKRACEDATAFLPTQIEPAIAILSVAYGGDSSYLYVHTADGLSRWGPLAATPFALLSETKEPSAYCVGVTRSSLAVSHANVLLLTDRMAVDAMALVLYSLNLDQLQILRWMDMHPSWPRTPFANPQIVTTADDGVLLVYEKAIEAAAGRTGVTTTNTSGNTRGIATAANAAAARRRLTNTAVSMSPAVLSPAAPPPVEREVVVHAYAATTTTALTAAPMWSRTLHPPAARASSNLDRCLLLRKSGLVDLGSPEEHLTVAGGHVTVEMWIQLLDKEDAATLYQHGDRSTNGEVFVELIKWEGTYCIRGGYRHDVRGSCLVSAPLPPTAEVRPFHLALLFNGRWRLFFEGEEVAGNRQGPHVSLDAPKQRWTVASGCTCLLTGLRVWRLGRTAREISRDYRRPLYGDEPGLVTQIVFDERSGNVCFNYVTQPKATHAVCSGACTRVQCAAHPWRSYGSTAGSGTLGSSGSSGTGAGGGPVCGRLHEWRDLALSTCCATRHALLLSTPVTEEGHYATRDGGRVVTFFDLATGAAHHSLFFLTGRSPMRHCLGSDPAGQLWEMFEVDAGLVSGEQEASYLLSLLNSGLSSAPQRSRDKVLAIVQLPMEEEEGADGLRVMTTSPSDLADSVPVDEQEEKTVPGASTHTVTEPSQVRSQLTTFTDRRANASTLVTYEAVSLWMLKVLADHADTDGGADPTLFSPLADDVSSRCVDEVRRLLGEHFRVVKANNARRAVALKSAVSWVVVAAALRVLLRLVRRVRAFGLHPGPLGLTVVRWVDEEGGIDGSSATDAPPATGLSSPSVMSEATMAVLLRELHLSSLRRRTSASLARSRNSTAGIAAAAAAASPPVLSHELAELPPGTDTTTLLGLLGDVINEDGLTLSPVVVALARTATIEGVELFLPDVRQRARLLRELLRASSSSTTTTGARSSVVVDLSGSDERVPAMAVLLDAVAQSFTTVLAAAPLMGVEDGVASLTELCATLRTLLEESVAQWRRSSAAPATANASGASKRTSFSGSLAEAIASLQLLLLSACQGSRWELALSEMYAGGPPTNSGVGRGGSSAGGASASASALDLQRLCFSQAATYHPCVRLHYAALFSSAEACLTRCVRASGGAAAAAAMVASLSPTFVTSPLHTALSAVPLVLTVEDASWFLEQLERLRHHCEGLIGKITFPAGDHARDADTLGVARQLLQSLWEAFSFAAVWVAAFLFNSDAVSSASVREADVRQRLGLASVTTTPTAQHTLTQLTAALDPTLAEAAAAVVAVTSAQSGPVAAEAMAVWNHRLLEGGLWTETPQHRAVADGGTGSLLPSPTSPRGRQMALIAASRRAACVAQLLSNASYWSAKQSAFDPLAAKTLPALSTLVTTMAAAALHLSSVPLLSMSTAAVEAAMVAVMRRLSRPVRTELLSRRDADEAAATAASPSSPLSSKPSEGNRQLTLDITVAELQRRCELLLRVRSCTELWEMEDALVRLPTCELPTAGTTTASSSTSRPLRRAWQTYTLRHMRFQAHVASQADLTLHGATQLVSRVILSREVTATTLLAALRQREQLASLRQTGVEHLLSLVQQSPHCAECVAQLLSAQGRGVRSHYEDGIRGAGRSHVASIRQVLFELIRWSMTAHTTPLSTSSPLRSTPALSLTASATVLCGLLDRAWRPRDLAFFLRIRLVPTLVRRYVAIFAAATATDAVNATVTAPSRSASLTDAVDLRCVALKERQHRDLVVAAQRARRSSRSALLAANTTTTPAGTTAPELSLQHTATEAMQARVWCGLKGLLLQCTMMLSKEKISVLSRVEQAAVMDFLADALAAIGAELGRCRDLLAHSVAQTPMLLVQVGDAAVVEPLVAVQDQVDLLCSLLSAVAGTLSCASVSVEAQAPNTENSKPSSAASATSIEETSTESDAAGRSDALFFSSELSRVCGDVACTLLELVLLDVRHARLVARDQGLGCIVRDATACARVAGLLLCRCQPITLRHSPAAAAAAMASVWTEVYSSPVFASGQSPLSSASAKDQHQQQQHPCLKTWVDLCVYALASTGLSQTTQHLLLALRRVLHQPAWASELRDFAAAFRFLVQAYAEVVRSSAARTGEEGVSANSGEDAAARRRTRDQAAVLLHVWVVVLGGQLLAATTTGTGAHVAFTEEKEGGQAQWAYVVGSETSSSSNAAATAAKGGTTSVAGGHGAASVRPVRGTSHSPVKAAAAMRAGGERVQSVTAVLSDVSGSTAGEELSLPPSHLFLPSWEDPVIVPPYPGLVEDFLVPAIQHCVPLLSETFDSVGAFSGSELGFYVCLMHLTSGVLRGRPDLAPRLIAGGALQPIRRHAMHATLRLPFPLTFLKELGAFIHVRVAEETVEQLHSKITQTEAAVVIGGASSTAAAASQRSSPSSDTRTSPSTRPRSLAEGTGEFTAPTPSTLNGTQTSRTPLILSRTPPSLPNLPGTTDPGEALLETFRSGGLASAPSSFHPSPLTIAGAPPNGALTAPASSITGGHTQTNGSAPRDATALTAGDYSLSRLARSFAMLSGPGATSLRTVGANGGAAVVGAARMPPRLQEAPTMFLAFPMWDTHAGTTLPHTDAALTVTPVQAGGRFPTWEDGFAVEAAVLLTDGDLHPSVGDMVTVPCSWMCSGETRPEDEDLPLGSPSVYEFPLITLYAADPADPAKAFVFLQIKVHRNCLSVVVNLPDLSVTNPSAKEAKPLTPIRYSTIFAVKTMRREDWHQCMHVAVMCSATSLTLSRNGETSNIEFRGDTGRRLEGLLQREGFLQSVVLGRSAGTDAEASVTVGSNSGGVSSASRTVDGPMALVSGLRLWGSSVLRTSVRVVAELVARDHMLQPFGLPEHLCFLELREGSGSVVASADPQRQYRGQLSGAVRWATEPAAAGFYPSMEPSAGHTASGVAVIRASRLSYSSATAAAFVDALTPHFFERFSGDVLWSLLALATRYTTVTALEVGMSPAYALLTLPTDGQQQAEKSKKSRVTPTPFDPRQVLDPAQKLPFQLCRLLQFDDDGWLTTTHEQLIHGIVHRLVTLLAAEEGKEDTAGDSGTNAAATLSPLAAFVSDAAELLRQLRRDDGERFLIEVPPLPLVASTTTAVVPALPLAFTNGGTGVLTFDAKYRNMEQATLYKDAELKSVLAKYPDGQGSWPACTLTATETPWVYLRSVPSLSSQRLLPEARASTSASILTVTVKSLKPVILHALTKGLCGALHELSHSWKAEGPAAMTRAGASSSIAAAAAAHVLDARVVTSLLQQSTARTGTDDCVHAVLILTELLQLWRCLPHVQPFDQLPLSLAFAHLNAPLCQIIQRVGSEAEISSLLSSATGTYSTYLQSMVGLFVAAVQLDCAWARRSYTSQLQERWRQLQSVWLRAAVHQPLPKSPSSQAAVSTDATNRNSTDTTGGAAADPLRMVTLVPMLPRSETDTAGGMSYSQQQVDSPLSPFCAAHPHTVEDSRNTSASGATTTAAPPTAASLSGCYPVGVSRQGDGVWKLRGPGGAPNSAAADSTSTASPTEGDVGATTLRSSVGFTAGVLYWEVCVTNITRVDHPSTFSTTRLVANIVVGVASERCVPTLNSTSRSGKGVFLGSDGESWGFDGGNALRYCNGYGLESTPRTRWKAEDVMGFILDIPGNRFCCLYNGRLVSEFNGNFLSPQQRASAVALFPVITCVGEGACEVNFGGSGFATALPAGCLPVDLSLYAGPATARMWQVVLAEDMVLKRPKRSRRSLLAEALAEAHIVRPAAALTRPVLTHPALPLLCRHLAPYLHGRYGPLDVQLLCPDGNAKMVTPRECKADKEASLLFGAVAVTAGRWYFELLVPNEPNFHVGWYACKTLDEQGGVGPVNGGGGGGAAMAGSPMTSVMGFSGTRPQLGNDAASWGLDAGRMVARHNKHQLSLARRTWKGGDVVGCLLDCDSGWMSFTVNGEPLVEGGGTAAGTMSPPPPSPPPQQSTPPPPTVSIAASAEGTEPPAGEKVASLSADAIAAAEPSTALFTSVSMAETRGLVPAIVLEPKSSLVCLWNEAELLYPPPPGTYRTLGGDAVVHAALVELVTHPPQHSCGVDDDRHAVIATPPPSSATRISVERRRQDPRRLPRSSFFAIDTAALRRLLFYASKVQELHPSSMRSYTMPALYAVPQRTGAETTDGANRLDHSHSDHTISSSSGEVRADGVVGSLRGEEEYPAAVAGTEDLAALAPSSPVYRQRHEQQQQRDLCAVSGLTPDRLRDHLAALLVLAHFSSLLYPFAHAAALPYSVEDAALGSNWVRGPLFTTLRLCRSLSPPWTALRMLQNSLTATNGSGDLVRLSVNRRKALTVVRDSTASAARRLRDSLFGQIYQLLSNKSAALFTTNRKLWTVAFYGEGADDVGGPYRECLTQMCTELMSPALALFLPSANMTSDMGEVRDGFVVNPRCAPPLELAMYGFIGRMMGGCMRGGEPLSLYLPSALWKMLVGAPADDTDLARIDVATLHALEYVEQLAGLTDNASGPTMDEAACNAELAELCPGGFTLLNDAGVVDELTPGGVQVAVTVGNAALYVRLVREHKLYGVGSAQRLALQRGFHAVVPLSCVTSLAWYELEELVCGQCDYDPDALLDAARLEGLPPGDTRVEFLRRVLRGFTRHQRALFMRFVSGRERLPPGIHLKIMPDDAPRGTAMQALSPQSPSPLARPAVPQMTPQPPPLQRSGSAPFARPHPLGAGQNNNSSRGHGSSPIRTTPEPSSPPVVGFTPPPTQSITLSPLLARGAGAPPLLQPWQLMSDRGAPSGANATHTAGRANGEGTDGMLFDDTRLPHASTCFYWLRLPRYSSAAVMAEKLLFAIEQCVDIDADFRVRDTDVAQQEAGPSMARVSSDDDDLFEDFSHLR